ncbi:MAG: class I SAM-dependent methyltransferase [Moorea sp. SIO3C2]|nr:class I SAM-dependent methyltransferase [Moorena sp. SIO3C2]
MVDTQIPEPVQFVGNWSRKSRIQIAYEMLEDYAPFNSLLDLGCGNLTNLVNLDKLFYKKVGVDIVKYPHWESLSHKFETYQHNLDDGALPFADSTFDVVTLLMVLEHVFDPFLVIEELSRVNKTGGYLVINVPNIAYIKHRFSLLFGQLPITSNTKCWDFREWDGGHIHYFTLERLKWLLEKFGGYRILQVQSSGRFGQFKRLYPSLLCSDLQVFCQKK